MELINTKIYFTLIFNVDQWLVFSIKRPFQIFLKTGCELRLRRMFLIVLQLSCVGDFLAICPKFLLCSYERLRIQ